MTGDAGWGQRAAFYSIEQRPSRSETVFWKRVLRDASSALIAPGGAGELAVRLARSDLEIVTVDREPAMVAAAKRRICRRPGIQAVDADLRHVELDREFDVIIVPRASLQLFPPAEDRPAVVSRLVAHLASGGRIAFEILDWRDTTGRARGLSFYDPRRPDEAEVVDWIRRLAPHEYVSRSRRQIHESDRLVLNFTYGKARSRAEAPARPFMEAQVVLWSIDRATLRDLGGTHDLVLDAEFSGYRRARAASAQHCITIFRKGDQPSRHRRGISDRIALATSARN